MRAHLVLDRSKTPQCARIGRKTLALATGRVVLVGQKTHTDGSGWSALAPDDCGAMVLRPGQGVVMPCDG